ncbi:MAG: Smr/MutS family protein, partial [Rikenellaceae bacterium]|nr:Smr/MutS family protein [Rikenellaceae bacterium]
NVERQLREIARDKNYWQSKRERIRVAEKRVLELEDEYSSGLEFVRDERRRILNEAKQQAKEIISEANRQIENTIREIREAQAERESTREARQRFEEFRKSIDQSENDERQQAIDRKIAKIKARAERKKERSEQKGEVEQSVQPEVKRAVSVGDKVRIKGQSAVGEVITLNGKRVTVAIGHITTTTTTDRLELISNSDYKQTLRREFVNHPTRTTGYDMSEKRLNFKPRIDVRGMRAAEAIDTVREFVDTAIMLGVCDLQILHGKGTGALLQEIRAYLSTVREVASARDEHVDFGGSGITVVKLNL